METSVKDSHPTNLQNRVADLDSLVKAASSAHYRLVWLVGGLTNYRSKLLQAFSESNGCPLVDIGQAMSQMLLDIPASLRPASVEECFADLLDATEGSPLCLDRLEILFEPSLKLYPSELVKNASRHRTILAAWPGTKDRGFLVFGPDGHPAHRRIHCEEMECQFFEISP